MLLVCSVASPPSARAASPTGPGPTWDAHFDYLYLNANEDQASGGHAAIRIDDDVFHFHFEDGLLRMDRDDWDEFQFSYRGLQNRSIERTRIAISQDTHRRLRATFIRQHLTQTQQIGRLRETRADRRLAYALTSHPPPLLSLPGLGFFAAPDADAGNERVSSLRDAIAARYGEDALARRARAAQQHLVALAVQPLEVSALDFAPGELPRPFYPFHARYADSVAAQRALELLRLDREPDAGARLAITRGDEFALQPEDRGPLERGARALEARLVELFDSQRPDWGRPMLLGMARLDAMHASLASGSWELLDVLSGDANRVEVGAGMRELLPRLDDEVRADWLAARDAWRAAPGWDERAYARVERTAAQMASVDAVHAGATQLRIFASSRAPRGMGQLDRAPLPNALRTDAARLRAETDRAQHAAETYAKAALGYRLITRNCVSELFATIDASMAQALTDRGEAVNRAALDAELELRLGGAIEAHPIPFVSSSLVRSGWRVESVDELPSLRRSRVAHLYAADPSLWIRLRESNTWTSTLYHPSEQNSYFVFFTDEGILLRPLQGVANLVAGLGKATLGLFALPFDRGKDVSAGLRGAMFSLPELSFFNIRKGTNAWLPPEERQGL